MGRWPAVVGVCAIVTLGACTRPVARPVVPSVPPQVQAGAAASLVRDGCLDCLISAYQAYEPLLNDPVVGEEVTAAAVRAAALIAIRERELGMADSGLLVEARALADSLPAQAASLSLLFEIIDTLGARGAPGESQIGSDAQLRASGIANRNRAAWTESLRTRADENELTAYLWLAFNCTFNSPTNEQVDALPDAMPAWRDTPLIQYRLATCTAPRMPILQQLIVDDPRFVEVVYYAGLQAVFSGDLDEADAELARAYEWRPRWPVVTSTRAGIFMTAEEFDSADDFYQRTLALVPDHAGAMLGRVRALTYLGRHSDALAVADALLSLGRWYVGDAHYWRALNLTELGRLDEAWDGVEQAAKLIRNADIPKLAGIIAVQRQQLPIARAKFEESLKRRSTDCEAAYYFGVVLSELREWIQSVDVLVGAADCLERSQQDLEAALAGLRASNIAPARKARQIARREQQRESQARMQATAWFNTAVASFNVARYADAQRYAERLTGDPQFAERAREMLSRLRGPR